MKQRSFDIFGSVALVKFPKSFPKKDKLLFAKNLIKNNSSIKTVLEKSAKFKGRLRKMQTKFLFGEKTKEVLYRENGCVFRFNLDNTYFSPRLSNERKEIADEIKKNEKVLVMFAGVAPFSIVIAKLSRAGMVFSNEINRKANEYGRLNSELNKVDKKIVFIDGDIKRVSKKLKEKFDVIVMPRPQLKDSFLEQAFILSKKGTRVYYYDFCGVDEIPKIIDKISNEAKKFKKKIKIIKSKKAGEIAPYKTRVRVDFKILN